MDGERLGRLLGVPDLPVKLDAVERCLADSLDTSTDLGEPSRRVAGAGGKRLRPAFTIACAALGGVYDQRVVAAAAAAELVQVGSLVHDDLMDGALTRRGTPTVNAIEGAGTALVTGDFMLARAGELAAGVGADAAALLATTIAELCIGQARELFRLADPDRTVAEHLESIRGKTAMLFSCSCRLGGLCADLPAGLIEALGAYGERFGMAFQVLDDVLDLIGDPVRLGKPTGVDLATGVYTLPVLVALEGREGARLAGLLASGDTAAAGHVVVASDGVPAALGAVERYAEDAADAVRHVGHPGADELAAFARSYLSWSLEAFVDRRTWPAGR